MDGVSELAKMFKDRNNQILMGIQIGKVVSPPPEIKISLGDNIILDKERLIIASHLLNNYQRIIEIPVTSASGTTTVNSSHSHDIKEVGLTGQIIFTDTIKSGDEVILIPTTDEQTYYLIDKAIRL